MVFQESDVVFRYTSEQAEDDGILFDVTNINPKWKNGLFNYVTTNLMNQGYFTEDKEDICQVNIPNLLDLLNQSLQIVKKQCEKEQEPEPEFMYTGMVELPSGNWQQVFIAQNETGKYTIMLPSDY